MQLETHKSFVEYDRLLIRELKQKMESLGLDDVSADSSFFNVSKDTSVGDVELKSFRDEVNFLKFCYVQFKMFICFLISGIDFVGLSSFSYSNLKIILLNIFEISICCIFCSFHFLFVFFRRFR